LPQIWTRGVNGYQRVRKKVKERVRERVRKRSGKGRGVNRESRGKGNSESDLGREGERERGISR